MITCGFKKQINITDNIYDRFSLRIFHDVIPKIGNPTTYSYRKGRITPFCDNSGLKKVYVDLSTFNYTEDSDFDNIIINMSDTSRSYLYNYGYLYNSSHFRNKLVRNNAIVESNGLKINNPYYNDSLDRCNNYRYLIETNSLVYKDKDNNMSVSIKIKDTDFTNIKNISLIDVANSFFKGFYFTREYTPDEIHRYKDNDEFKTVDLGVKRLCTNESEFRGLIYPFSSGYLISVVNNYILKNDNPIETNNYGALCKLIEEELKAEVTSDRKIVSYTEKRAESFNNDIDFRVLRKIGHGNIPILMNYSTDIDTVNSKTHSYILFIIYALKKILFNETDNLVFKTDIEFDYIFSFPNDKFTMGNISKYNISNYKDILDSIEDIKELYQEYLMLSKYTNGDLSKFDIYNQLGTYDTVLNADLCLTGYLNDLSKYLIRENSQFLLYETILYISQLINDIKNIKTKNDKYKIIYKFIDFTYRIMEIILSNTVYIHEDDIDRKIYDMLGAVPYTIILHTNTLKYIDLIYNICKYQNQHK